MQICICIIFVFIYLYIYSYIHTHIYWSRVRAGLLVGLSRSLAIGGKMPEGLGVEGLGTMLATTNLRTAVSHQRFGLPDSQEKTDGFRL